MKSRRYTPGDIAKTDPTMPVRELRPNRSVLIVGRQGLSNIGPELVSAENVGWKAYGQAALPAKWVPAFFVIGDTAASCDDHRTAGLGNRRPRENGDFFGTSYSSLQRYRRDDEEPGTVGLRNVLRRTDRWHYSQTFRLRSRINPVARCTGSSKDISCR